MQLLIGIQTAKSAKDQAHHQVGERVTAELWRDGAAQAIDVTLEELPR